MKKIILLSVAFCGLFGLSAQAPSSFNYQAALRNSSGNPLANQAISLRFSIRNTAPNGTVLYQETQNLTTTAQGLANCQVGSGTVVSGAYPNASQWAAGTKYLQIEIDAAGGSTFTALSTTQIVSVPYANYAANANQSSIADSLNGMVSPAKIRGNGAVTGQVLKWNGTEWIPDVDNSGGSGGSDNWGTQTVISNSSLAGNGTSGNPLKIAQQGAGNGQILKWNGSNWVPANDSAGGTYTAGTGISFSGSAINSTWTANGNHIHSNNSGNVGIGNTNPAYKLDVSDDARINGYLGLGSTNPDGAFVVKSSGSGNREMLMDATGAGNYSGLQLRGSAGANDFLSLKKYGSSASGTFTDGTAFARAASITSGNSVNRMVIGTMASNGDVHLITGGRTRLQIASDGNIYTGTGTTPGAKLFVTKGTQGYTSPTGAAFAPAVDVRADSSVNGFFSVGVATYASSKRGSIGGAFVAGRNATDTQTNYGVYGEAAANVNHTVSYAYGGYTYAYGSRNNYGMYATAYSSRASTLTTGVIGYASGESQTTTTAYGVYGFAEKASTAYAGYFNGNTHVQGTLTATSKSFLIDHPLQPADKYLQFTSIESPDMLNVFTGNVVTDEKGFAIVSMPDYFQASNTDFRYQLTVIGEFAQAIVKEEMADNRFTIQSSVPNVKVSWQVTAVRNDAWAQQNRIQVVKDKAAEHRGRYLNPEAFGKPASYGIHYITPPQKDPLKKDSAPANP